MHQHDGITKRLNVQQDSRNRKVPKPALQTEKAPDNADAFNQI
jgi:hypothetical protein